jgi:hypothetical protein
MSDEMKTALLGGVKIAPPEASRPVSDAPKGRGLFKTPSVPITAEIIAPLAEARGRPRGAAAILGGQDRARRWGKGK